MTPEEREAFDRMQAAMTSMGAAFIVLGESARILGEAVNEWKSKSGSNQES